MKIKITKRGEVVGGLPAASKDEYVAGTQGIEGKSIPVDYWLEGDLIYPIRVGERVQVNRTTRNGVECTGFFISSPVTLIVESTFYTANSVYDFSFPTPDEVAFSA